MEYQDLHDGAGRTNRKTALSRIPTYVNNHSKLTSLSNLTTVGTLASPTLLTPALGTPTLLTPALGTPALGTPALGTPALGVLTNCTGTAAGVTVLAMIYIRY